MTAPLLLTGASGGVGWHLVRELLRRERPLVLLLRPRRGLPVEERARRLFPGAGGLLRAVAGDVTRPDLGLDPLERPGLRRAIAGVVHLAARTDFRGRWPEDYRSENLEGALAAASLALEAGVPLWHASTAYVAGDHPGTFREEDLELGQTPRNGYERSKLEAERALVGFAGLELVRLRLGVVLPDAPVAGIPPGPGPLHHLRILSGLRDPEPRTLRLPADPDATLALVPADWTARAIADLLERRPRELAPCLQLVPERATTIQELVLALHRAVPRVRLVPTPRSGVPDADPLERLVARRCAIYEPYQRQTTTWTRTALEAALGPRAATGVDPGWLDRVFAAHLAAWEREAPAATARSDARALREYFGPFLAEKLGRPLLPGLRSLSRVFSITVPGLATWTLALEAGRLIGVEETAAPAGLDYALAAPALLRVVRGEVAPQALFFSREVRIAGPAGEALALASALTEFFRRFPFRTPVARTA